MLGTQFGAILQNNVRNALAIILVSSVATIGGEAGAGRALPLGARAKSQLTQNMHAAMEFFEEMFTQRLVAFLIFLFIALIGLLVAYIVPAVVNEILTRFQTPRHWRAVVRYVLQIILAVLGLWVALAAVGVDFLGIALTFGVLSIVLSAGLSGVTSNVFAGILLQTSADFEIGHVISVAGITGVVEATSLATVRVRLRNDSEDIAVIPNAILSQSIVQVHNEMQTAQYANSESGLAAFAIGSKDKVR